MKLERLLSTILILLNRRKITARELADHFEVSLRTIYRDVDTLNRAGIPVISLQGQGGGYAIPEQFKLRHQLLTPSDMRELLATLKGINQSLNHRDIERVIQKFSALLPPGGPGRQTAKWDKMNTQVDPGPTLLLDVRPWGDPHRMAQQLKKVQAALDSRRTLTFTYTRPQGRPTSREVEPHTLAFKGHGWYLLAFCRLRQGHRVFKLARMDDLELTPTSYSRKTPPKPAMAYFAPPPESMAPVEITLEFNKCLSPRLKEYLPDHCLEPQDDGGIRATLSLPEDEWLYGFILGFGPGVEVLSPPALRRTIGARLAAAAKQYK
ncbi:MAG: YafY family transcriptional regulator [Desulfobacterales bacterium]|nr:YafY family transcriptional regulator [Desulfobacterales bacterium]